MSAGSSDFPPKTEADLREWVKKFVLTGDISPEGMGRDDMTTTDRFVQLMKDEKLAERIGRFAPALLCEWTTETSPEITERLCYVAGYAPNDESVIPLLEMFQRTKRDHVIILRVLGEYLEISHVRDLMLAELRKPSSPLAAEVCMNAVCRFAPEQAAQLFRGFLDFVRPDALTISVIVEDVPDADRAAFIAVVTQDERVRHALTEHPLTTRKRTRTRIARRT